MSFYNPYEHKKELMNYSYHTSLYNSKWGKELADSVTPLLSKSEANLNHVHSGTIQYNKLKNFFEEERKIEIAYLNSISEGKVVDKVNSSELIKAFTELFQNEYIYKQVSDLIKKSLENDDKKIKTTSATYAAFNFDFTKQFNDIVEKFLETVNVTPDNIDEVIEKLIKKIEEDFGEFITNKIGKPDDKTKTYEKDMEKLLDVLDKEVYGNRNSFISDVLTGYGLSVDQIKNTLKSQNKRTRQLPLKTQLIKVIKNKKGSASAALEQITTAIIASKFKNMKDCEIDFEAIHGGDVNNMKADVLLTSGEVKFDKKEYLKSIKEMTEEDENGENKKIKSVRMQNIKALEKFFNKLEEKRGDIVFISEKDYDFRGRKTGEEEKVETRSGVIEFSAEKSKLNIVKQVLEKKSQLNQKQLNDLIFIAVNVPPYGIGSNKQRESAARAVALNVAYFLFDDVAISESVKDKLTKNDIRRIHLLKLNDYYVPLSVILEGLFKSLQKNSTINYKDYARASITYSEESNKADAKLTTPFDKLTKEDWIKYYNIKLENTSVHIHFLRNFGTFLQERINEIGMAI